MGLIDGLFQALVLKGMKSDKMVRDLQEKNKNNPPKTTGDLFKGRLSRTNYAVTFLALLSINIITALLIGLADWIYAILIIWWFIAIIISISINIRRLHDINKGGWMIILFLIPLVNIWLLINLLATDSVNENNKYGPTSEKKLSFKTILGL